MIKAKVDIDQLIEKIAQGDVRALARALTFVENDISPANELLKKLQPKNGTPIIGITGPPGAGKSTLVNAITDVFCQRHLRVGILAVDPTSPFNYGSLLGDRIRMAKHFNHPNVYIRSIATRGSLGGLSSKTMEMLDVLRAAAFDVILVETVGVGQSEVEIAGLADKTVLVLVPEAGDEIQHIKSGLMEIAQAFVVNKADREGADGFANKLQKMLREQHQSIPVFKTVAEKVLGVEALCDWMLNTQTMPNNKKTYLLAQKAFQLIEAKRMKDVDKAKLISLLENRQNSENFNLYAFVDDFEAGVL
ncbi:methylmalonyl Co-A mutase-associated GTPase MeaB [Nubsella zeaxanthinifaciens]|uniref:methylmalonyl Co-A mutase-associated GTPase MeaB n=1 Tax=Nubsella zeaxanthinifaciens TaxID=392412 RepID=UPI003D072198